MKNYDYWKSFVSTGKIDDYLHYIACTREEGIDELVQNKDSCTRGMNHVSSIGSIRDKEEGGFSARINYCDGDGSISHAGW